MSFNPRKLGARCDLCPRKNQTPVPPEGPRDGALWVWLGQDPGEQEVKKGRPFIGPTGTRLTHVWAHGCEEVGTVVPRSEVFIINTSACLPLTKRDSEAKAAADCCYPMWKYFMKKFVSPAAAILSMGRWAFYQLTGKRKGVGKYQGFYVRFKRFRPMPDFEAMEKKQRKAAEKAVKVAAVLQQLAAQQGQKK